MTPSHYSSIDPDSLHGFPPPPPPKVLEIIKNHCSYHNEIGFNFL